MLLNKEEDDDDDLDEDEDDVEDPLSSRKCKRKTLRKKVGRISNGDDFWSKVDAWFEEEIRKCDRDLSGSLWRMYVYFLLLFLSFYSQTTRSSSCI